MIVNLIKSRQMFSLTLPNKIKGQYWLTDTDSIGNPRELISIEAVDGTWVLKSNKKEEKHSKPPNTSCLRLPTWSLWVI